MAKLIDKLLSEKSVKEENKNYHNLSIKLDDEQYNALTLLSKITKISKSKLALMAMENEGLFDIKKIEKKLNKKEE